MSGAASKPCCASLPSTAKSWLRSSTTLLSMRSTTRYRVEDAATLAALNTLGVDIAQGFHIGYPMPEELL